MISSSAELRNHLKLRQLTLLASLGETGSLHKAAERCGMSQPAATRLIHELEELMGVQLFERTSRGMVPTDMGRLLIRHASMFLAGIDHVYHEAIALKSGNAGNLRLGVMSGAPPQLVANAIALVKLETPRMDIQVVDGANEFLLAGLHDGSVNIVVGRAPAAGRATATFELLFVEHFSVVCGPSSDISKPVSGLGALLDQLWILPLPGTALRANLDVHFLSQCGRLPQDVIESTSIAANVALIELTGRVAVMPRSLAREHRSRGQVRVLIDKLADLTGPIGILTRMGETPATHILRMAEALRTASRQFAATELVRPEVDAPVRRRRGSGTGSN